MVFEAHECPQCGGAIPTEDTASESLRTHTVTYLYCEFCSHGWETLWLHCWTGTMRELFTINVDAKTDAVKLGQFLQRLRDRRAA